MAGSLYFTFVAATPGRRRLGSASFCHSGTSICRAHLLRRLFAKSCGTGGICSERRIGLLMTVLVIGSVSDAILL